MSARSYLYVPGDRADMLAKAPGRGADALICDLEDAVAHQAKDSARANVAGFLGDRPPVEVWVRVNSGERMRADVRALLDPAPRGFVLPKASVAEVAVLSALLDEASRAALIVPLVETAGGVLEAPSLARAPRVARLALGEADLRADLGVTPSADEREMLHVRSSLVVACAAAGIEPPNGPVSTDFRDLDAFRVSTDALRRLGFGSRSAIHPAQVEIVNDVFTPSAQEVARARRIVEVYETAGGGVCVDDDGRMVDEAVVRSARRTLARAGPAQGPRMARAPRSGP